MDVKLEMGSDEAGLGACWVGSESEELLGSSFAGWVRRALPLVPEAAQWHSLSGFIHSL